MNDLLFDVPWWIPALLGIVGISLFVNGNKRQINRVRNSGVGLLLLAIGWALLSHFVDTDKNKVEKGTRQFIQTGVTGDWDKFKSFMTPSTLFTAGAMTVVSNTNIADSARTAIETYQVKSAHVQHMVVEEQGSLITAKCDVISTQEGIAPIENSSWQFDWEKTADGWKLHEIRLISLGKLSSDDLARLIPKKYAK